MSRSFDGANDRLYSGGSALDLAGDFTVAAWVYPSTSAPNDGRVVSRWGSAGSRQWLLGTNGPGRVQLARDVGGEVFIASGTTVLSSGAWQHVVGRFAAGVGSAVFYNGASEGTHASTAANSTRPTLPVALGSDAAGGNYWPGLIALPAVWGIALSDAEIAGLAAGDDPATVQAGSLLAYWLLGGSSPEPDAVGSADLTVDGATYSSSEPPVGGGPSVVPLVVHHMRMQGMA